MWQKAKNVYHLLVALLANSYFGFPGRALTVIGVTGTDGKTTTASLIYHILTIAGKKVALISTVGAFVNGTEFDTGFHVTTPNSFAMQSYLRRARDTGVEIVVLEVTSHALDQNRVYGIPFSIGVITNITHEHLDYHGTYENYVKAKLKLFQLAKRQIINRDDESYRVILKDLGKAKNFVITYGMAGADVTAKTVGAPPRNLIGEHNTYNFLAAAAVCRELGVVKETIQAAAGTFSFPKGRMEIVFDEDFTVIIDFAHTPNAFKQLLQTLKKTKRHGRLIHVFGSAGLRDKTKRPMMGEVASEYDDIIILTAEDPRTEPVSAIINEIASGVIRVGDVPQLHKIVDRQEAIELAISFAKKHDIVVITGKGHEKSINYGKGEIAWSDHEAVKRAISKQYEK
ncbi:MAG: UDP-N-acetylmuramoyl-L-alanyl-D-glutamate--2,6-diaminopimelate ligase [bacterium]|nr:UDP-N-acetylmuramoyl-L-alanyl-D-glutamate--2,6-diaminopimelate ligase [bacterium]